MALDIDRLRVAAKRLKKAFASGDGDAARRLRAAVPGTAPPKHADFLHVIAREQGYESWPKLKLAAEAAGMTRAERASRTRCVMAGAGSSTSCSPMIRS